MGWPNDYISAICQQARWQQVTINRNEYGLFLKEEFITVANSVLDHFKGVLCKIRKTNLIIFNQTYIKLSLRLNILIHVLCFHIVIESSNEIHSIII